VGLGLQAWSLVSFSIRSVWWAGRQRARVKSKMNQVLLNPPLSSDPCLTCRKSSCPSLRGPHLASPPLWTYSCLPCFVCPACPCLWPLQCGSLLTSSQFIQRGQISAWMVPSKFTSPCLASCFFPSTCWTGTVPLQSLYQPSP
jgi:hypothetical protein